MLILDVPTCWSSTYQMLRELPYFHYQSIFSFLKSGRALDYREAIDIFLARNRDLCNYELSVHEWECVILVTEWLDSFRSATTQMSTTKCSMVSFTHAIFRGLQDYIKTVLGDLPGATSPQLILGLTAAHAKLGDYYYKFDESPLYTWASRMSPPCCVVSIMPDIFTSP
jgi:hypothetical protein